MKNSKDVENSDIKWNKFGARKGALRIALLVITIVMTLGTRLSNLARFGRNRPNGSCDLSFLLFLF